MRNLIVWSAGFLVTGTVCYGLDTDAIVSGTIGIIIGCICILLCE